MNTQKVIIVDIDGTLADSDGRRSPYDESKVLYDRTYPVVLKWVNELSKDYRIFIVSGRHDSCSFDTEAWLDMHNIPYDRLYMRKTADNRSDTIVKYEILHAIVDSGVNINDIEFVLDDRPKVIRMWKEAGLKVYPVRGAVDEF